MDEIDKTALLIVGGIFALIIVWGVFGALGELLGLLFGSDKKKRD